MSETDAPRAGSGRPAIVWILFVILTIIWAGAYSLTRIALGKGEVAGLPAEWVLPARLTIGAATLLVIMLITRRRFPPLTDRRRWGFMLAMGVMGSLIPFFLITVAQETVNSSLAALYTAAGPVFVTLGASVFFAEERMTKATGFGVALGFAGILALFGPEAANSFGSDTFLAQSLLLVATLVYASSTLVARGAPLMEPLVFAAGYASISAVLSWGLVFQVDPATVQADWRHWTAILVLGMGSSGIAQLLFMALVARAGATFLSLTGYSVPIVGVLFGWLFFRETQSWNVGLAFILILGGVWLARRGGQGRAS